jgi:hypothetical protein
LQNTPQVNLPEQDRCMKSRTRCWRLARPKKSAAPDEAATATAAPGCEATG